jgi:hypothetical protein
MDRGDHDGRQSPPNPPEGADGSKYDISAEAGLYYANILYHDGSAFGHGGLMASQFPAYPLTPLEGPRPHSAPFGPQTPLPTQVSANVDPNEVSPAEPCGIFEAGSFAPPFTQSSWPGAHAQQVTGTVDGQPPKMLPSGFMLPQEPQYPFDPGCFPPVVSALSPYGVAVAGEGTISVSGGAKGNASDLTFSAAPGGRLKSEGGPSSEKPKKKRGRPRLYEDNGAERPKRKPGRPPTYAMEPSSASSTSPLRSFRSPSSASRSSLAVSPGFSVTQEPGSSVSENTSGTTGVNSASSTSSKGKAKVDGKGKGRRASDDEDGNGEEARKQAIIRGRNKTAATRYRAKTQAAIALMEAEERDVSARRRALIACISQLREEAFHLKNEVLRQAECGCPLIAGYLSDAARLAYAQGQEPQLLGGITNSMGGILLDGDQGQTLGDTIHTTHLENDAHGQGRGKRPRPERWT